LSAFCEDDAVAGRILFFAAEHNIPTGSQYDIIAAMQIFIQLIFSVTLIGFIGNVVIGYLQLPQNSLFPVHLILGLTSTFLGVFITMLSMSYYLATRDKLTEENKITRIPADVLEEAKRVKKGLFSACGPAMIVLLLNATMGGCVYVKIVPPLVHHVLAYLSIMSLARAFRATLAFHRFRKTLLESVS
jgi:hypothetical protein